MPMPADGCDHDVVFVASIRGQISEKHPKDTKTNLRQSPSKHVRIHKTTLKSDSAG